MNKLSAILDAVIDEVDKLTDSELQAEFEASKGGPVGRAIIEGEAFLRDHHPSSAICSVSSYSMTMANIGQPISCPSPLHNDFIGPLNKLTAIQSDEDYIMAA